MLKCFYILIWITAFKLCFCQRRMGLGNESVMGKKYLVYFVKSQYSNSDDDAWLCAGAIVTPTQILTAAACLVEMNRIYAIAGYKKYVHARDIEKDKCTNTWKKKVVKISVPKEYTTSTIKELEWMNVDIGVATVLEPYDFNDQSYITHCSYVPESITINNDKNNELENTRAVALGWGGEKVKGVHNKDNIGRCNFCNDFFISFAMEIAQPKDLTTLPEKTLKQKLLQEATTTIIEKKICANLVPKNGSKEIVNKYLLCASGNGFLGENGDETTLDFILEKQSTNRSIFVNNATKNINQSNEMSSRKSALIETCQNDHGGPLVSWVGNQEMILGVALNGICNPNFDCVGPRIYVSTAATAQIIKCLLETYDTRRKTCNDQMGDKQYQVNDIEIKWPEDLKNNSTSSLTFQQIPSFRRQNDEEETLHVRPTKDLRSFNEQKNQENPPKNQQEDPSQYQYNNNKQQQRYMSQQQIESQNQPEIYSFNQPQMESYNQPPLDPYYNQAPLDSYNNQPQMVSRNPPELESYNQPQTESNNPPSSKQNNQKKIVSYQPQMTSQNHPPRPINKDKSKSNQPPRPMNNPPPPNTPQMESLMPSQVHLYNQPEIESFQQPQTESYNNSELGSLKLPQSSVDPLSQSQYSIELGSLKLPQSSVDPLSQSQYSYKEPESLYSHSKIESVETKPTEPYNPLDIIMADDDDTFKRPMEEPYMSPHAALRNRPNVDSDMSQPFKPELDKQPPFEQSHLSKYQSQSPHHEQPLMQPVEQAPAQPVEQAPAQPFQQAPAQPFQQAPVQPFEQAPVQPFEQAPVQPFEQAPAQSFDPGHPLNVLHSQPHDPATNPSQDDSQTFEQMFSQLHAGPEPSASAPPPKEETFDELYRNLHDGKLGEEFETRLEQPIEQEVEQTDTRVVNEPPANEPRTDVQVRHQMPLEYPEY